jgi:hypothetical protein
MKILTEKDLEASYFPVSAIIIVTSNEKIRKVICETTFRRLRTL